MTRRQRERDAVSAGDRRTNRQRFRAGSTAPRVVAFSLVLALFGAAPVLLDRPAALADTALLPWWAFAALFAVTEACVVRVRIRRQYHTISLSEIPLVIGLFLAVPTDVVIGRVVGSMLVFLLYRRQTLVKAGFNTALVAACTAAAEVAFFTGLAGDDPLGWRGCLAALVAAATAGLLAAATLVLVVRWYDEDELPPAEAGQIIASATLIPAAVGLLGVVPVMALSRGQAALPVAVTGAILLVGYRAFATLAARHADLERLYRASDALAVAPGSEDVVRSALRQGLDLLGAAYGEILLGGAGPEQDELQMWSMRAGETEVRGPSPVSDLHRALRFPPPRAVLVRPGASPAAAAFLGCRGISEALVVPLRIDAQVAGHLLIADHADEVRSFAPGDLRLLETVANHAGVAYRNGRLIERLHFEARHDELTGLPNRLSFRTELDEAGDAAADGRPCAVMVLDFNGFKAINDTLGHHAGDELLRVLAGRFAAAAGSDATVARLGGDEFAVLATGPAVDASSALELANRLLAAFEESVPVGGVRLRVGGSLGIALGPEHGTTGSDLLRNADAAMYAAKTGSGGARLFTEDLADHTPSGVTLAGDLRDALRNDEVGIVVQPLVELDTGVVHSLEVLARWHHPELGEISPEEFFAAAERSGQTAALSANILDQALRVSRSWLDAGLRVRVAINLAARWLTDPTLPEQVGTALARHGIPPDLLCLELTETSVIADPRRTTSTLERLRDLGVHLSVDDFGTGYSSLTYLSRLPVDQLKIDRTFVQRMADSTRDRAIVQSIIDLGRNLGIETVAEGVTDPATRRTLREMGCRLGQGYLFTQPVLIAEVPAMLDRLGAVYRPTAWESQSPSSAPELPAAPGLPAAPSPLEMPAGVAHVVPQRRSRRGEVVS